VQIVADGADDHLTGVEPDTDAHGNSMRATDLLGIRLHGSLHRQGGVTGSQSVVFMGQRRSKQCHNPVPQDLIHRAFKAMHRLHHDVNGGIEELLGRFRVEVLDQLGGVFDVGKQNGDLLTLTFQGVAGGEDFFGEMLGRVGEGWRGRCGWWCRWLGRAGGWCCAGQRCGARITELGAGWIECPTGWTPQRQRGGAFVAKLRAFTVVMLTLGTLHRGPPLRTRGR
jgi:hypothetical protein